MTDAEPDVVSAAVLDVVVDATRTIEFVASRKWMTTTRRRLRLSAPEVRVQRLIYWPLALIYASASGRTLLGGEWRARIATAADRVTGRCGIVDADLPSVTTRTIPSSACVPVRCDETSLRTAWREFFWEYVVRHHRSIDAPSLTIDQLDEVWLPYHVVAAERRHFLVDLLTGRVDRLDMFPEAAVVARDSGVPAEAACFTDKDAVENTTDSGTL